MYALSIAHVERAKQRVTRPLTLTLERAPSPPHTVSPPDVLSRQLPDTELNDRDAEVPRAKPFLGRLWDTASRGPRVQHCYWHLCAPSRGGGVGGQGAVHVMFALITSTPS